MVSRFYLLRQASTLKQALIEPIFDFICPPACLCCYSSLASSYPRDVCLCEHCLQEVVGKDTPRCQRCNAPCGPSQQTPQQCLYCRDEQLHFDRVVSVGVYSGPLRRMVLEGKSAAGMPAIRMLSQLLYYLYRDELHRQRFHLILPVAHSWWIRWLCSHLPAETIGSTLADNLRVTYDPRGIRKVRRTPQQHNSPPSRRRRQQLGAFRAHEAFPWKGARVLLTDDVLTTGGTADACARELKQQGVETVWVAVLARGLGRPHISRGQPSSASSSPQRGP